MATPISSATRTASSKEEYASLPRDDVKPVPPSRRTFIKASAKPYNGAYSGYAVRVSLSDFSSSGVEYLNLADTNSNLKGFRGGFATDAHAYYVPSYNSAPNFHGYAARVSLSDFSSSGVEYLNLADTDSNLKGFDGGFATDAHAYYVPFNNGAKSGYAVRVSLSDFSSSGVEYLNLADTNSNLKGFGGGFATAAHAYYVPHHNGAYSGYAARVSLSI
ncbi:hypothetical protein EMIHUDRAFT_109095 [Emiliania huxleyi CCMP1516]|uniref:Uncharacterized protein n=2 Tax=Emiliania huxleyi TaxID=2903 RepID=A0A0D3KTJ4_EMIH1|nr:hypothetical protein EMIHUDRAFT_109095 [Emiliania huxleyi CCMP1516]EOD39079.1 hypothetical protein EMIHUDRAFT_109095 [Emiliania huxleyi CCMP1516]|eukprot:XP_005791508.1 hypothetical protein EMIHUDRAFT_109095 [Emiliania huxleyi CCMP1516]